MGIAGELLEAELILRRLARFAEADLIWRDDAIAGLNERGDGGLPCGGAEILAVQQYRNPSGGARWLHVHVSHLERLALRLEAVQRNRPGIVETLKTRAITRPWVGQRGIVGWPRLCCVRYRKGGQERQHSHERSLKKLRTRNSLGHYASYTRDGRETQLQLATPLPGRSATRRAFIHESRLSVLYKQFI